MCVCYDMGYKSIFPTTDFITWFVIQGSSAAQWRSTKRSEVQSTCKMSRGWMMRRELRCEGLVGRARRAMARSIEGTRSFYGFKLLVLYAGSSPWFHLICLA